MDCFSLGRQGIAINFVDLAGFFGTLIILISHFYSQGTSMYKYLLAIPLSLGVMFAGAATVVEHKKYGLCVHLDKLTPTSPAMEHVEKISAITNIELPNEMGFGPEGNMVWLVKSHQQGVELKAKLETSGYVVDIIEVILEGPDANVMTIEAANRIAQHLNELMAAELAKQK